MLQRLALLVVLFWSVSSAYSQYEVPEATLEFRYPSGLKISIPDTDDAVTLVAFHINLNEEFSGQEHGRWSGDIEENQKEDGRWSYVIDDFNAKQGDTVYYWIYVIRNKKGYQALNKSFKITRRLQFTNFSGKNKTSTLAVVAHGCDSNQFFQAYPGLDKYETEETRNLTNFELQRFVLLQQLNTTMIEREYYKEKLQKLKEESLNCQNATLEKEQK